MLQAFLVLLERFVVAHELIASNSGKPGVVIHNDTATEVVGGPSKPEISEPVNKPKKAPEIPVEGEDLIDAPVKSKAKTANKSADDLQSQGRDMSSKPRQTKPKEESKGPELTVLRDEIKTMAKAIAAGDSDECADQFDELLEDYNVRTVTKLTDEQVPAFYAAADDILRRYYTVQD